MEESSIIEETVEPVFVTPLTKKQKARKAKNKVAKQSRKKNRP